jgi:hypothetical protein
MRWIKNMYPGEKKKSVAKRRDRQITFAISSQSGASLLLLIIALLIMGVLGAAMYAITSTSYFNQVSSQDTMKALYITESGQRIVASEYKAAAYLNSKLADLNGGPNGRTFTMEGSSTLTINIYPYWLYASAQIDSGLTGLKLPGSLPLLDKASTAGQVITFPTSGLLKIYGKSDIISFTTTGATAAGTTTNTGTPVTFATYTCYTCTTTCTTTTCAFYPIPIETNVFIGFVQNESSGRLVDIANQTVSKGGNLIINTVGNIASFFPPEDGNFSLDGHIVNSVVSGGLNYHYDERKINVPTGKTTLTNVQSACLATVCPPYPDISDTMDSFTVQYDSGNLMNRLNTTRIYVGKNMGIRSTGVSGN